MTLFIDSVLAGLTPDDQKRLLDRLAEELRSRESDLEELDEEGRFDGGAEGTGDG